MSLSIRGPSPVEMFDNPPWSDAPFPRTPFERANLSIGDKPSTWICERYGARADQPHNRPISTVGVFPPKCRAAPVACDRGGSMGSFRGSKRRAALPRCSTLGGGLLITAR
jgi:hypothetical protein